MVVIIHLPVKSLDVKRLGMYLCVKRFVVERRSVP
jgi:hypothetical protein